MDLDLSPRERDVLRLLAEFRTNAEIAEALVISVKTAETHVEHILRKLNAPDRREAGRMAREVLENG
ncbi:MAG TPA: helix-turn-helix transcriptional regulator [Tepidiformaceae bacterium]|nr:helix-turn-helix transcriptional regulator [Tepidiformaceae bacterium]